jgi:hypothetical protein
VHGYTYVANEPAEIVSSDMSDQKIGREPGGKGGPGVEKEMDSEVVGREKRVLLYTCWACGAANYVDPSWTYFTCWRCGPTVNYIR